ncbi:uncharacterized protein LOC121414321 isoform X2 [Lytechinus variegatus]|uniref:uncharacterized protein LOC121414319 isoform X2 n=1 Tax=Lytechinus variegatus TaxID=7654 RepID=UPI001BB2C27E|nr:uncharacterized protein LOC121414319 isoform X2 [Lytechinus variegatus]XP_041463394.1 uncharacterized protein LOC121414321 isoform X2 [Lytechinus variegatus]
MATQGTVPKCSYTFLKLQIVALCCLTFWLFYSPPKLEYLRHNLLPARTPLVSSTENIIDVRSRQTSLFHGAPRDELNETSQFSSTTTKSSAEGRDHVTSTIPTHLQNITYTSDEVEDDVSHEGHSGSELKPNKWFIKWQDRDFSLPNKSKKLPITEGYTWKDSQEEVGCGKFYDDDVIGGTSDDDDGDDDDSGTKHSDMTRAYSCIHSVQDVYFNIALLL